MANESMGLLGLKLGMTQLFEDDGTVLPCTVVQAGPCPVLQVKTTEGKDGYNALQIGFGGQKVQRKSKADLGHLKAAAQDGTPPRVIREVRVDAATASSTEVGSTLLVADLFEVGQVVDVTGISKGKGFQGVMKRYNFAGFIRSHGTHEFFRHGGSIGTRLTPGHVLKGKRMPGQMGDKQVTVQNLRVAKVDAERNLIYLVGGVPGARGASVMVRRAVKAN